MSPSHQQGTVLIAALVILLVLTAIGLASMRAASLQERIAGNLLDQELAMQAAEAALRVAEAALKTRELDELVFDRRVFISFEGVATDPSYSLSKLATLRDSTEAGVAIDGEGYLIRIEATGHGRARSDPDRPAMTRTLSSVYMVRK